MTFLLVTIFVAVEYQCVRWTWSGDIYKRVVYCLEWKKVEK
jgi:hypothetical protein